MNATTAPLSTDRRSRRPSTVRAATRSSGSDCSAPAAGDIGTLEATRARASALSPLGRLPMTAS